MAEETLDEKRLRIQRESKELEAAYAKKDLPIIDQMISIYSQSVSSSLDVDLKEQLLNLSTNSELNRQHIQNGLNSLDLIINTLKDEKTRLEKVISSNTSSPV